MTKPTEPSLDKILTKLENWVLASTDGLKDPGPYERLNHKEAREQIEADLIKIMNDRDLYHAAQDIETDDTISRRGELVWVKQAVRDYVRGSDDQH